MIRAATARSVANFQTRMRRLGREARPVRDGIIQQAVRDAVAVVVYRAPRDTQRWVRAVAQAANAAQAGPQAVAEVRPGKHHPRIVELLESQVDRLEKKAARLAERRRALYPKGPPAKGSAFFRRIAGEENRALTLLARSRDELAKARSSDSVLLFGFLSGQTQKGRALLTVRLPIYGGTGEFVSGHEAAYCRMVIREPHHRFVEARHHLFAAARKSVSAHGIGRLREPGLRDMATRAGFKVGRG